MSLKLGPIPDRNPVKMSIALPPDVHDALSDYAAIYKRDYGSEATVSELGALMIEKFLDSDSQFKRARKLIGQSNSAE